MNPSISKKNMQGNNKTNDNMVGRYQGCLLVWVQKIRKAGSNVA